MGKSDGDYFRNYRKWRRAEKARHRELMRSSGGRGCCSFMGFIGIGAGALMYLLGVSAAGYSAYAAGSAVLSYLTK